MAKEARSQKLVLVVEDEEMLRSAIGDKLSRAGFLIVEAQDGKEGLSLATEKKPDLILLDILMPRMGGIEMLDRLREDSWGKRVPVIALTNVNDITTIRAAIREKVQGYLVKSDIDLEELLNVVKRVLP